MKKTGEELFNDLGYKLLWKHKKISVIIEGKEHDICSKDKLTSDKDYDEYNYEITKCFYKLVQRGLLKDISKKKKK
jgi:hypothetical protein